jgi:hypothetical protein
MKRSVVSIFTRLALAVAVLTPGLAAAPRPASAASSPCGEQQSLPGPGRYVGGFKGILAAQFNEPGSQAEFAVPLGGTLEFEIDDGGHMVGASKLVVPETPETQALPIKSTFDLSAAIDGQLTEPLEAADLPHRATVTAGMFGASGNKILGWTGTLNLHLLNFRRPSCATLEGTWLLEGSNSPETEEWSIREAVWSTTLIGFDEGLDQRTRAELDQIAKLPPIEALTLRPSFNTGEADAMLDALAGGAAAPPGGGLFALYEKVRTTPAAPGQIRCLTDLIQTAIAVKLQEYMAAGATPTYEETARVAYALRVGQVINSGPKCPAYAMGLGMLRIMIHVGLNEARAAGDAGRVARLTRLAQLHDLPAQARRGTDWLAEPGRPI